MTDTAAAAASRFARLSGLLGQDPGNLHLVADAADAAFAENLFDDAQALIERYAGLAPLPPAMQHLAGLVAMHLLDWPAAADRFAALLAEGAGAPPVRFNLAWSLAMAKRFDEALAALDDATSQALPQSAQLEVQLLHQLGEFDRAVERARLLIEVHPDHHGLSAAVSTLAIDVEDIELAGRTARNAGDHPEALTTLGTLALDEDDPETAARLFDAALARNPNAPRAVIGRGLVRLIDGDTAVAALELDRGAELFGDHLGSWIAAGWAHVVAGEAGQGKARFEKALALDDSFAETQGSLAVIDILEGRIDEGRRRTQVALRLDRECFSGALAALLLAAGEGDADKARRILGKALDTPVDGRGRTLAGSLARMASRGG
jgi:tetratricopeptide (TPR) repeat protein